MALKLRQDLVRNTDAACEGCPLAGRNTYVPPDGPAQTPYAIVGESPGSTERFSGKPFVGESGEIIWSTLSQFGLKRSDVYVTNVVKCYAPPSSKNSTLSKAARVCKHRLMTELESHGAKWILALGNEALEALTGMRGITSQAGKLIPLKNGMKVIPAVHPAAMLRVSAELAAKFYMEFVRYVSYWANECSVPTPAPLFRDYQVIDSEAEAIAFLKGLKAHEYVAVDIETSGFDLDYDEILCVVFSCNSADATILPDHLLYKQSVVDAFNALKGVKWVGHNIAFDFVRLSWKLGIELKPYFDTLVAHYNLSEMGPHDLKTLAQVECGAPDWEAPIKAALKQSKLDSYAVIPRPMLYLYAAQDGIYTWQLFELFSERLRKTYNADLKRNFFDNLMPIVHLCIDMQLNGMRVDVDRLADLRLQFGDIEQSSRTSLRKVANRLVPNKPWPKGEFNPNSPQQVAKILYDVLKAPVWSESKIEGTAAQLSQSGGEKPDRTTAKAQLERLTYQPEPIKGFADMMLSYRNAKHVRTHYLNHFEPISDGRIHPIYQVHRTVTGRLASTEPNVLNMPHKGGIRNLIVPEEGNILIAADYSQAELRVAAMLSGDETFKGVYIRGEDIHDRFSTRFYGPEYTKIQRVIAKSFVFGKLYGRGWHSIAETFGLTRDAALAMMRELDAMMPTFKEWCDSQFRIAQEQGYVGTPLGRRRRFPLITRNNAHEVRRYCVNSPIQATSSDILLLALRRVNSWIGDYDGKVLMPLHDSGNFECPEEVRDEVATRIVADMEAAPKIIFGDDCIPFKVDIEYGYSLEESLLSSIDPDRELIESLIA